MIGILLLVALVYLGLGSLPHFDVLYAGIRVSNLLRLVSGRGYVVIGLNESLLCYRWYHIRLVWSQTGQVGEE